MAITPFPCPFSVLAIALYIHKINKQECSLARKGHGNGVNENAYGRILKANLNWSPT